ncbi:cupin domain-containing protein [Massilia sp. BJB1822]|uniref:cupin domain-containing protein n=1 Tax=Massilia sp. BJB1822 TaxID=2744470 RepID=UPI001592E9AB|nr:cupin domain-containing protein [Massilia sp. BJB1822]NVD97573.1 cupin domain-containing protein [Massilia sp. BJB1822]
MSHPVELLTAAQIAAMKGEAKTHLLNPEAQRASKSLGGATGLSSLGFHQMTVQPGRAYSEYHRHLYEEQCFYILSGQGEAIIEEQRHTIGPGDFLGFPAKGAAHTIVNTGSEPLVMLSARVNLEQDVCDYPRLQKRLYMNGVEEAVVDFVNIRIEGGA